MASGDKMNVLLLVVDALRADRCPRQGLTPNVDRVADRGREFTSCFSCTNTTEASLTSMLTGQLPTRHGVVHQGAHVTTDEVSTVRETTAFPERLPDEYRSVFCDILSRWLTRGFDDHRNPKFDRPLVLKAAREATKRLPESWEDRIMGRYYRHKERRRQRSDHPDQFVDAASVTDSVLRAVESGDDPWFVFGHYWETHTPYLPMDQHDPADEALEYPEEYYVPLEEALEPSADGFWPEKFVEEFAGEAETVADVVRKYDAGVRYVDRQIGRILDALERRGEYEDTVVVITADHGESLTERDILFSHHGLHDPTIHVPLMVGGPGLDGTDDRLVQHTDVVPTLLDLLGIDADPAEFDGHSLLGTDDPLRDGVVVEQGNATRKRAFRNRTHKLVRRLDDDVLDDEFECGFCGRRHGGRTELYRVSPDGTRGDRETPVDDESVVRTLAERMDEVVAGDDGGSDGSRRLDDSVARQLDAMGYRER